MDMILTLLLSGAGLAVLVGILFGFVLMANLTAGKCRWWLGFLLSLLAAAAASGCSKVFGEGSPWIPTAATAACILAAWFAFLILWFRFKAFRITATVACALMIAATGACRFFNIAVPLEVLMLTATVSGVLFVITGWIAFFFMGEPYFEEKGAKKEETNQKKAKKKRIRELQKKIKKGNLNALCDLADSYLTHPYYSYEKNKALYMVAAQKGSARAQFWVSEHANRYIKAKQEDEANYKKEWYAIQLEWLKKAADQGYVKAMCKLGLEYLSGYSRIVGKDLAEAEKYLVAAAEKGSTEAAAKLGRYYASVLNKDKKRDMQKALAWTVKAAEGGDSASQYLLGEYYRKGEGVEKNCEQAVFWLEKAADKKYFDAMNALATLYGSKKETVYDQKKQKYWKDKVLSSKEYKEREKKARKEKAAHAAAASPVDLAAVQARVDAMLNKNSSRYTPTPEDDMEIMQDTIQKMNAPNYDPEGFPDSSSIW